MAEIIRAESVRAGGPAGGVDRIGHVMGDGDAPHRTSRRRCGSIIPPTGNEVISMLKTTSLVTAVPYTLDLYSVATPRNRRSTRPFEPVPLLLVAAPWYLCRHQRPDGRPVSTWSGTTRAARRAKLTTKQLEALAKAQTTQLGEPHL